MTGGIADATGEGRCERHGMLSLSLSHIEMARTLHADRVREARRLADASQAPNGKALRSLARALPAPARRPRERRS